MLATQTTKHKHTAVCWQETHAPECYEHHIHELEKENWGMVTFLSKLQLTLREGVSLLQKADGEVERRYQLRERKMVEQRAAGARSGTVQEGSCEGGPGGTK